MGALPCMRQSSSSSHLHLQLLLADDITDPNDHGMDVGVPKTIHLQEHTAP